MANQAHLEILMEGTKAWNKWRKYNPSITPDLSNAHLRGMQLRRINFRNANLQGVNFREATLDDANLYQGDLRYGDLREVSLVSSDLREADLRETDFMGGQLMNADFNGAHLYKADLRETNLTGANFRDSYLYMVDFFRANLSSCDFSYARIGNSNFGEVDLSVAIGLADTHHQGPSTVGTNTLTISKGSIPEKFLQGCGLSKIDIEYTKIFNPNLTTEEITDITYNIHHMYVNGGIRYYSCFISYSSKDHMFAQQLFDDLQNNGVRCWFDREDIKIGEPIRSTIDRQIRLRDKLLVILSESSIQSEYVGDEVEAALEEEQKNKRLVVFPIRIDDAPLNTRDDWAAKIKRRRHIGDFSNWKDETSYKKAFERLLRDFKATE